MHWQIVKKNLQFGLLIDKQFVWEYDERNRFALISRYLVPEFLIFKQKKENILLFMFPIY